MEDSSVAHVAPEKAHSKTNAWRTCILLTAAVVLLLASTGYLWMQLQTANNDKRKLQTEKVALQVIVDKLTADAKKTSNVAQATQTTTCNDTPTTAMKQNIKAALDSKNTAAFQAYFSNPVTFVIAASEKGGSETATQAAVDMDYANTATGPWDFALPASTLSHYDAGFYTQDFDANTYVGRAASKQVVAFDFDCNGKIKQAFLAASEDLL